MATKKDCPVSSFRVTRDELERFQTLCNLHNLNQSEGWRFLLAYWWEKSPDSPGRKLKKRPQITLEEKKDREHKFILFWEKYPVKVDEINAKKGFYKVIGRMEESEFQAMLNHCSTAFRNTPEQYIPHPKNYLAGERWKDQPKQSQQSWLERITDRSWTKGL